MDIKPMQDKLMHLIKKYRYVILIVLIGVVLMAIPSQKKTETKGGNRVVTSKETKTDVNEEIAEILSLIKGTGKVRVLLTTLEGEETIYQTNEDISKTNDAENIRIDTVIITDAQRNQSGLIRQINPVKYKGALVVCEGADNPAVQLAIVDAVSKITGLSTNRISVLKMK